MSWGLEALCIGPSIPTPRQLTLQALRWRSAGKGAERADAHQATLTPGFAPTQVATSGRSCPTFLIDLGSRHDSSPYCMR